MVGHMEKIVEDRIAAKRIHLMRTIPDAEISLLLEKYATSLRLLIYDDYFDRGNLYVRVRPSHHPRTAHGAEARVGC